MTPEQQLQHDIMHAAVAAGWEIVRLNLFQPIAQVQLPPAAASRLSSLRSGEGSGISWRPGSWVLHGPLPESSRGVPDLLLVRRDCPPILLEVKTPTGRLSVEQRGWHARYGLFSCVVRSVADAETALNEWRARYGAA